MSPVVRVRLSCLLVCSVWGVLVLSVFGGELGILSVPVALMAAGLLLERRRVALERRLADSGRDPGATFWLAPDIVAGLLGVAGWLFVGVLYFFWWPHDIHGAMTGWWIVVEILSLALAILTILASALFEGRLKHARALPTLVGLSFVGLPAVRYLVVLAGPG